ncbi:MAG: FkbM family methyltransferase [Bacteroidia bacterium]
MNKILTYSRYLFDYLKHGEWGSIFASLKYIVNKSSHQSDRIIETSVGTFFCRKNTNDFQFANLYYEWGVKKFILKRLAEFSVFIDAGSCIGEYCILLAKKDKKCFAFEPVSDNIHTFEKNITLNGLQNKIRIFPFGLGEDNYQSGYFFNPVNTGDSKINKVSDHGQNTAEIRKLDSMIADLAIDPDESIFMKLDIEGMEAEGIRGATEFIRKYPKLTLIIEDKHSGKNPIRDALNEIAVFEYGPVDEFNMYAKKIRNF